ncbi:mitochondrial ribosome assembly protein RRG9 [Sporobolomyces salmoneus]|uniref:mitochondrial ribosome assembly protein RRG9 n=1 Tax=Sporobolomyces salmoneus TaxID=183962 RepID=UPI003177CA4F
MNCTRSSTQSLLSAVRNLSLSRPFPLPSRFLSTSPSLRSSNDSSDSGQAKWDTFDLETVFRPATSLDKPPRRAPRSPTGRNSPSSSSRSRTSSSSSSAPTPRQRRSKPPPPPPPALPNPSDPNLSLDSLTPSQLSSLRLDFIRSSARVPTSSSELTTYLPLWLKHQHSQLTTNRIAEERKSKMREKKREGLDKAWEWERVESEKLGLERTEEERRKDEVVRRRIERRLEEKREKERVKEGKEWERLTGSAISSSSNDSEGGGEGKEGKELPEWKRHQLTLRSKFPGGWAPPKRISREAMDLLRTLHSVDPEANSVTTLSEKFKISKEAVRRVLKSRFELSRKEREKREGKRKEERMKRIEEGGDGEAWEGDRGREKMEMRKLRERKESTRNEE